MNTIASQHNNITESVLPNNITLITESIKSVKTVSIGFWFECGSRYETNGEKGISHFVEHMLFKGTKTKTAFDIAAGFDRIGGYVNAFTEREQVCLHCVVPAIYTKTALVILCDMVEHSTFNDEEIERERKVIISEIISSLDDPEETALDASVQAIWPKNAISTSIIATKKDIKKITKEALLDWYNEYFVKGSVVVSVSGNIDISSISNVLSILSTKKPINDDKHSFILPKWNGGVHFIEADFQQEQLFVLYPVPVPLSYIDYYALAIVNALVGDTMSSRLFQSLRERSGSCYSVYSFVSMYSDCAYWCAYASSSKKNVVSVVKNLREELSLVLENGFTEDEIIAAKEHIVGEEIIASEDMEQRMKLLAKNYYLGFEQCSVEQTIERIRAVTKDDITRALTALLDNKNEALLIYGPKIGKKVIHCL